MMVRIAITETKNAYEGMPESLDALHTLEGRLAAVRDANLDHHEALIRAAAAAGVKIIGLGELFTGPYFAATKLDMWKGLAESATDGVSVRRMSALAAELSIVIVAPIYEIDGERRYNTAVVLDADGANLGRYRKTHIPHGGNEQGTFFEGFYYGRADDTLGCYFPVFDTRYARVGVAICYDRHFEGVMSALKDAGADLVFSPAVTFGEKSERMWEMEFEVDAARHRLFIAGSNRLGVEPPFSVRYFGRSYVAGPDGRVGADRSLDGLVIADVDLDVVRRADPSGWRLLEDRRRDIY
jgi:N-carbamoylputrescine amidase